MSYQQAQYPTEEYEMQSHSQGAHPALELSDFLAHVDSTKIGIRSLAAGIQHIANLHQRALSSTSIDSQAQQQLDQVVALAQQKNATIRDQIQTLKLDAESTPDSGLGNSAFRRKKGQVESLTAEFKKEVRNLLQEQQRYDSLCRDQIARQYRIVNPDATEEEAQSAADRNLGEDGIFQTALRTNSARTGQASMVMGAVKARQNEMLKVEQSLAELARLFQDLDTLVVQDGVVMARIEEQTYQANEDLAKGTTELSDAQKKALSRRKNKWRLFWVVLVILIIIAVALVIWKTLVVDKGQ